MSTTFLAVLYDMDGLMVDTEPIHFLAFQRYLERWGVDLPESAMVGLVGLSEWDNLRDLKEAYSLEVPLEEMVAARRTVYLELVAVLPVALLPGFLEFATSARERGLRQAVASSAPAVQVEAVLGRALTAHPEVSFDAIVAGDEVAATKPAPDGYLEAAHRLAVAPDRCLALEDSPAGVQAAVSAGMTTIAVPQQYTAGLSFPGASAVLPSLYAVREWLGWGEA